MSEKGTNIWKGLLVVAAVIACVCIVVGVAKAADKLVFVNVPSGAGDEDLVKFQPILDYVAATVGIEIEYMTVTDYAAVIQAMQFGYADMARLGPFQYVQARILLGAIPIARDIKSNTGEPFYYTLILASSDSAWAQGTVTAEDLQGHSIAYVSPTSTSGSLVPKTLLFDLGATDDTFSEIYFAGSHAAAISALVNGMVDIACTNEFRYLKAIEAGVIAEDDVTIMFKSNPIPTDPVVIRPGLGEEMVARLMMAWLTVPAEACEAFKLYGFAPVLDEDYAPIRAIATALDLNP